MGETHDLSPENEQSEVAGFGKGAVYAVKAE